MKRNGGTEKSDTVDDLLERIAKRDPSAVEAIARTDTVMSELMDPKGDEINQALRAFFPELERDDRLSIRIEIIEAVADTLHAIVHLNDPLTPSQLRDCFLRMLGPVRSQRPPQRNDNIQEAGK